MANVQERVQIVREWGRTTIESARLRRLWFDHLVRTFQRYQLQSGDRLAGAVTYFAFLSFFPIIALAFAVFGYFLSVRPDAVATLQKAIDQYLPGLADRLPIQQIADSRTGAGVIGLLGLLYAGLGAIDALRGALREMSMTTDAPLGFALAKLRDLAALILVGATMVLSVVVGGFATQASGIVAGGWGCRSPGSAPSRSGWPVSRSACWPTWSSSSSCWAGWVASGNRSGRSCAVPCWVRSGSPCSSSSPC